MVATAVFSVMPYSSNTGMPRPMKNSSTSGAIGAAPEEAYRQYRSPIALTQGAEEDRTTRPSRRVFDAER